MSKCHFLSSYCIVSKVRLATRTRGKFGRPKSENTLYMLEPSILHYDRAEHEEIHLTCGSHIACFGVQIWSSFTTSTVFEIPAWTLNVLTFIHLQYYRVLGLWTSNHPTMTDSRSVFNTSCCTCRLLLWLHLIHLDLQLHLLAERCINSNQRVIITTAMAYPDPSFSSVNS